MRSGRGMFPFLFFLLVVYYNLRRCLLEDPSFLLALRHCSGIFLHFCAEILRLLNNCEAARVGLQVNERKTQALHIGSKNAPTLLLSTGWYIASSEDFTNQDSRLMNPESILAERRARAWRTAYHLRALFHFSARDALKVRLAPVRPLCPSHRKVSLESYHPHKFDRNETFSCVHSPYAHTG